MSAHRLGAPNHARLSPLVPPTGPCRYAPAQPTTPSTASPGASPSSGVGGSAANTAGTLLRDTLRQALVVTAVLLLVGAVSPHRVDPPPLVGPYPLQYVAICCARPVYIQELKR